MAIIPMWLGLWCRHASHFSPPVCTLACNDCWSTTWLDWLSANLFLILLALPSAAQPHPACLQAVSGLPLAEFLEQNIFEPLGMVDTSFWSAYLPDVHAGPVGAVEFGALDAAGSSAQGRRSDL